MKRAVFVILLGFVTLTKAISYHVDCKESNERCSSSTSIHEEKMVCASNGKTYQNK